MEEKDLGYFFYLIQNDFGLSAMKTENGKDSAHKCSSWKKDYHLDTLKGTCSVALKLIATFATYANASINGKFPIPTLSSVYEAALNL